MALSYNAYVATSGQTQFAFTFPFLSADHVKVQINGVDTSSYTVTTNPTQFVTLTTGATAGQIVKVYRLTPGRSSAPNNVALVDFVNGSVLSEEDLDKSNRQLLYLVQETQDIGVNAIPYDTALGAWNAYYGGVAKRILGIANPVNGTDAANKQYVDAQVSALSSNALQKSSGVWNGQDLRITSIGDPISTADAATKRYVDSLALYGGASMNPQSWDFQIVTGDWSPHANGGYYVNRTLSGLYSQDANTLIVSFGGVLQTPGSAYTLASDVITLYAADPVAGKLVVRNFGVSRSVISPATTTSLGVVRIGSNLSVDSSGLLSGPGVSLAGSTGSYTDLINTPTLGTAAALNVAVAGNASSSEVVKGNDSRLTDTRTPSSHTHSIADILTLTSALSGLMPKSGGLFTGSPQYASDPTTGNDLARKLYVDNAINSAFGGGSNSPIRFSVTASSNNMTVQPWTIPIGTIAVYQGTSSSVSISIQGSTASGQNEAYVTGFAFGSYSGIPHQTLLASTSGSTGRFNRGATTAAWATVNGTATSWSTTAVTLVGASSGYLPVAVVFRYA